MMVWGIVGETVRGCWSQSTVKYVLCGADEWGNGWTSEEGFGATCKCQKRYILWDDTEWVQLVCRKMQPTVSPPSRIHRSRSISRYSHTSQSIDHKVHIYEVHPKSNWKMWIKRDRLQLGGYSFWNFSKHPLLIWLHCCFHHYKTLKAVAMVTLTIVVLTHGNFYHFRRPKFDFQPLSFIFETFGKKLAETNARVNVKKIKAKK